MPRLLVPLFLSLAVGVSAYSASETTRRPTWRELASRDYAYSYDEYLRDFGKTCVPHECEAREAAFNAALDTIKAHNEAQTGWKMGVSPHTDSFRHEWQMMKGYSVAWHPQPEEQASAPADLDLPASVDWREKGVVTPVKDQRSCGSCWAFSATEVLESHVALNTRTKVREFAPQEFVDCAPNPRDCGGTGGCSGSTQWLAFNYSITAGIAPASAYPYQGHDAKCKMGDVSSVAGITGYQRLPANSYSALMFAVATIGPIAVSVDASWHFYEEGVYDSKCGTHIDHAVALVGYGSENGTDYWLVRNSWGTKWGEAGYIRIKRFGDGSEPCGEDLRPADGTECKPYPKAEKVCGLCGILSDSSYPTGGFLISQPDDAP